MASFRNFLDFMYAAFLLPIFPLTRIVMASQEFTLQNQQRTNRLVSIIPEMLLNCSCSCIAHFSIFFLFFFLHMFLPKHYEVIRTVLVHTSFSPQDYAYLTTLSIVVVFCRTLLPRNTAWKREILWWNFLRRNIYCSLRAVNSFRCNCRRVTLRTNN